jgi:hypothetical protein
MASIIQVDEIQNSVGQTILKNGYTIRPGQIIEYLSSPCDGSNLDGLSGTYTWPNVTAQQTLSATYQDLTGSSISYTPPEGTKTVLYKFEFAMRWEQDHAITHHKFFIGGVEVLYARFNRSGRYPEDKIAFSWPIAIGGNTNTNTGRQATWTTPKTLNIQSRWYGASNARNAHGTTYWDGGNSNQFIMPVLTLIAIA